MQKRELILICTFFLIILVLSISIFNNFSDKKKGDCYSIKNQIEQDICFFNDAVIYNIYDNCRSFKECPTCSSIEDPYLKYMCNRFPYRPHMFAFTTTGISEKIEETSIIPECNHLRKKDNMLCTYSSIAKIGKSNLTQSFLLCNKFNNENFVDECKFFSLFNLAKEVKFEPNKISKNYKPYCESFSNFFWKSECYFLFADEFSFLENNDEYIDEIYYACNESTNSHDFQCFDHVAHNLPIQAIPKFCNQVSVEHQCLCQETYGFLLGMSNSNNFNNGMINCSNLLNNCSRYSCFAGLFLNLNDSNLINEVEFAISLCKEQKEDAKIDCFSGLGTSFGDKNSIQLEDPDKINDVCNIFPNEYRDSCYTGMYFRLVNYYKDDLQGMLDLCNEMPINQKSSCYNALGRNLAWWSFGRNFKEEEEKCNLVPEEQIKHCIIGFNVKSKWEQKV